MLMKNRVIIALPKGRLYETATELLGKSGIVIPPAPDGSRKLVFPDAEGRFEFVPLKPVDIPVYVESGTIDAGIVGSDVLRENEADVYEPVDLGIGRCRLVLAAPAGVRLSASGSLRVATKYPRTTERFFRNKQLHVHIVKLDGSVEIAPLLGLAEAIVDLVETGRTLRENGMNVVEDVASVSAKLIINRTSMKMKSADVRHLITQLDTVVYENPGQQN
jgi:ATP phosphoribosyltransferase